MVRWTLNKQLVYSRLSRLICLESPGNLDIRESIVPGKHHAVHVGQAAAWREDAVSLEKATVSWKLLYISISLLSIDRFDVFIQRMVCAGHLQISDSGCCNQ